jgi:hypothetical protein
MIHLINFSHLTHKKSQERNSTTGLKVAEFDWVHQYNFENIPDFFQKINNKTIDYMQNVNPRGAGYWFWKPFIIFDALNKIDEGDYAFYCDSGAYFTQSCKPSVELMKQQNLNVMCYVLDDFHTDRIWSRQDTRFLLNSNFDYILDSPQIMATHMFLKNCLETKILIANWMTYCQDFRVISDEKSIISDEENDFKENRHDQSAWSVLCKKRGYLPFKDPSGIVPEARVSQDVLDRSKYEVWICNPRDRA